MANKSKQEKQIVLNMTGYDHIHDMATISFLSSKGNIKVIRIHRSTFSKLMDGRLGRDTQDRPTSVQQELKEVVFVEVKKDFMKWFSSSTNALSKLACTNKDKI